VSTLFIQAPHSSRQDFKQYRLPLGQPALVVDNYATHKHPEVKAWLAKHPRFHIHFTPTSSSWLNMFERFFRDITVKRISRGVFTSVTEFEGRHQQIYRCA